jgi:hypothetical protein
MSETEIRINKRWVERSVFIVIITVLIALYITKDGADPQLESQVTKMQDRLAEQATKIDNLEEEKSLLEAQLEEPAAPPPVVAPVAPPKPVLSGKLVFSWNADAKILTPAEYNSDEIAEKEAELEELQDRYDDTDDSGLRGELRDKIGVVEDEIDDLKAGDSKLQLNAVTLTVDNGKETSTVVEYEICWLSIECTNVKSEGILNIASASVETFNLSITMPTLVSLDKQQQSIQLRVLQDDREIFREQESFSQPR